MMRKALLPFLFSMWLWPVAFAVAQDTPEAPPPQAPPGFQPVKGGANTETVDANKLVVAAYAAILIGVAGYVVMVSRKQAEIAKEMQELAARLDGVGRS